MRVRVCVCVCARVLTICRSQHLLPQRHRHVQLLMEQPRELFVEDYNDVGGKCRRGVLTPLHRPLVNGMNGRNV